MQNSWQTNWQPDWPAVRANGNGTMLRMPCHYFSTRTRRSKRLSALAFNWFKPLLDRRSTLRVICAIGMMRLSRSRGFSNVDLEILCLC